jgi:hypothetical protein
MARGPRADAIGEAFSGVCRGEEAATVDWSWSFKVNASDIPTQPNQYTGIAAAM